jgi:hypothetical protein
MPIHVKYEVRDIKGNLMNEHATYTMKEFKNVEEASDWIRNDSDSFVEACTIDSKQIDEVISDDLVIVEINGFPVTEEREVA